MKHTCPECGQPLPTADGVLFDPARASVARNGKGVRLTPCENQIFKILFDKPKVVHDRWDIWYNLYGHRPEGEDPGIGIITVFIHRMRKKLAPLGLRIETHWGLGLTLAADEIEKSDV